ncbi:MAG: Histone deacetylase superfamily, partial [Anaeromyxobacteraceae bacterium]|nr:Histone deacetylase superfamily [Anaeromyxobacteraceae bacterium]
ELSRVHDPALLESLSRPETLAAVFGVDPSDVPVDEVMRTVRLATGATIQAAGEALRRVKPQLNLLGGFHHAGPSSAGGNCPVNDIAAAIASVRADGFEGKVAVLDLDAHPPDGVAACLASDPDHWIGSISGSDWGPLPGVDEVLLPEGTGNARYLDELRALLGRMPRAGLVFVIAGGDVLRGDRLGKLDLTLGGTRLRDVAVAAHLEGVPSVWLPGGAYSRNAWKVLAGVGLALSTGSLDPIPEDHDPIGRRFAGIAAQLSRQSLSGSGEPTGELTDDDVAESLGMRPTRQRLLLGFYTEAGIEFALQRYGILDQLRRLGYDHFRVEFGRQFPGELIRVHGESDGKEQVLMELVLERKRVAGHPVLYIHWLSLRHPRAQFSLLRPRLPGQEVPGLGLARETGELLALMALRLQLTGVVYRPAHFHTAFAGRHHFSFVDAARQGRFEALIRDLGDMPLLEATRAIDEGRVFLDGKPYSWEPDEMVLWLREHPEERGEAALERDRARFSLSPEAPASPSAGSPPVPLGQPGP